MRMVMLGLILVYVLGAAGGTTAAAVARWERGWTGASVLRPALGEGMSWPLRVPAYLEDLGLG